MEKQYNKYKFSDFLKERMLGLPIWVGYVLLPLPALLNANISKALFILIVITIFDYLVYLSWKKNKEKQLNK